MTRPCDLRGQPSGPPLTVSEHGTFNVTIRPMAPLNVLLGANSGRKVTFIETHNE